MIIRFEKLRTHEKFVRIEANGILTTEICYKYNNNQAADTAGNLINIIPNEQVYKLKRPAPIQENVNYFVTEDGRKYKVSK
jgi:hypothetical protein